MVSRSGGVGSPVGLVSPTSVADFFQHCGVEKIFLSSVGVEARRMLQTNQVVEVASVRDKGKTVAVENRLLVKKEWQPLGPFPWPRVQAVEHIHETPDILP